jgi:hypothetical protein
MARCPFADWRPIPESSSQPWIWPTQAIVHTAAVNASSLFAYFSRPDISVESHFFVQSDGGIEQYLDTIVRGDANFGANGRAISIETEDGGDPLTPWTPAQGYSIIRLLRWICEQHVIPTTTPVAHDQPGVGYHTLFPQWTNVPGKTCPGRVRIAQFNTQVLPALSDPEPEEPMQFTTRVLADPDGTVVEFFGHVVSYASVKGAWPEGPTGVWWVAPGLDGSAVAYASPAVPVAVHYGG